MVTKHLVLCDHCLAEITDHNYYTIYDMAGEGISYEIHADCLRHWASIRHLDRTAETINRITKTAQQFIDENPVKFGTPMIGLPE
jgi:hypothetical protein